MDLSPASSASVGMHTPPSSSVPLSPSFLVVMDVEATCEVRLPYGWLGGP
jgi:hypothetical protein